MTNLDSYLRLVGKLNYLVITRPDISFVVSISQFMSSLRIIRYLKAIPGVAHCTTRMVFYELMPIGQILHQIRGPLPDIVRFLVVI